MRFDRGSITKVGNIILEDYNDNCERLKELLVILEDRNLSYGIFYMKDHKGFLFVFWELRPSTSLMKKITKIWDTKFNEYEVIHHIIETI